VAIVNSLAPVGDRRMAARRREGGFTLVEAMITVAIVAILATLAAPSFDSLILRTRLVSLGNDIIASTQLARSEAIKRNAVVVMCASANGTSCAGASGNWSNGWIVALADGSGVLSVQRALPSGWRVLEEVATAQKTLSFQPAGVGTTSATLVVCRNSPLGSLERKVTIRTTGSATAQTTTAGSCS